jgi:hypothetical protein
VSRSGLCIALAVAALACGSGDDSADDSADGDDSDRTASTASTTTETTDPPTPEQAFLDQVEDAGALGSDDAPEEALEVAQTLCDDVEEARVTLERAQEMATTPVEGDENLGFDLDSLVDLAQLQLQAVLTQAALAYLDSDPDRAVMSAAADHLCPGPAGDLIDEYVFSGPAMFPPASLPPPVSSLPPLPPVTPSP